MDQILRNLQDVPGVIGSFVFNTEGALVGKHMPPIIADDVYPELGRRLAAVFATLDSAVSSYDDLLLKFKEHWLSCRRTAHGLLGVLSTAGVNHPALRMAAGVAALKLDELASGQKTLPAAAAAVRTSAPAPAATTQPVPAAPKRYWRGQPVD